MKPSPATILHEALERSDLEERAAYLDEVCGDDSALRAEIEALIEAHGVADDVLGDPKVTGPVVQAETDRSQALAEGPGSIIDNFKLLQLIGEGGFGAVYMAEQEKPVRRRVALKIIKLGMDTRQVIARFEAERQALAMMDHPNIAKVLGAGATDTGRPYFVMEMVPGIPITDFCDQHGLSTRERLELMIPVCLAIQHAHQKGIIHRDIKPSNVLVTLHEGQPVPKVIDFGIAKATNQRLTEKTLFTRFQQFLGTPEYMSPEQAGTSGLDVDSRTDVYSLGVLLYELLTGTTPFDSERLRRAGYGEMQRIIRDEEPPKPSTRLSLLYQYHRSGSTGDEVDPGTPADQSIEIIARHRRTAPNHLRREIRGDLDWIVMRCLEKDRARRYETVNALAFDIRHFLENEPIVARPPSATYHLRKFVGRHRAAAVAVTAFAAVVIVSIILVFNAMMEARRGFEQAGLAVRQRAAVDEFFLRDIFGAVDPDASQGQDLTVREVLDLAAQRADRIDDPVVQSLIRAEIGRIFNALGRYDDAKAQLTAAIRLQGTTATTDPLVAADARLGLAMALDELGDYDWGEQMAREALDLLTAEFDSPHIRIGDAWQRISEIQLKRGEAAASGESAQKAIDIYESLEDLSDQGLALSGAMSNLAAAMDHEDQTEDAIDLVSEALALRRAAVGQQHTGVATLLTQRGRLRSKVGQHDLAHADIMQAIKIRKEILPENHPEIAQALNNLGTMHLRARRPDLAEQPLREALALYESHYGPKHEYVAAAKLGVGQAIASQPGAGREKLEEAEGLFASAVAIYDPSRGYNDWQTLNARLKHGFVLSQLESFDRAEPMLLDVYTTLTGDIDLPAGIKRSLLMYACDVIAGMYQAWEKPQEAVVWTSRLEDLRNVNQQNER